MNTYSIEIKENANILTYQLKVAENCMPAGVIVPRISVEQGRRRFVYDVQGYSPVFATRVSKEDVILAEQQYARVCEGLKNTLLEPGRLLYSARTVYRDSSGRFFFLYYPADPVDDELNGAVLEQSGEEFVREASINKGIKEIGAHVGFAIACYCLFVLIQGIVSGAAIIVFALYGGLCLLYHVWPRLKNMKKAEVNDELSEEAIAPEPICFNREIEHDEETSLMEVRAKLISAFDETVQYDIGNQKFIIGRNINLVHLYIPDNKINPIHAEIGNEGEDFYITDRCSRNGTYINGTKIEPEVRIPLYGEEEIRVGQEVFFFKIA